MLTLASRATQYPPPWPTAVSAPPPPSPPPTPTIPVAPPPVAAIPAAPATGNAALPPTPLTLHSPSKNMAPTTASPVGWSQATTTNGHLPEAGWGTTHTPWTERRDRTRSEPRPTGQWGAAQRRASSTMTRVRRTPENGMWERSQRGCGARLARWLGRKKIRDRDAGSAHGLWWELGASPVSAMSGNDNDTLLPYDRSNKDCVLEEGTVVHRFPPPGPRRPAAHQVSVSSCS